MKRHVQNVTSQNPEFVETVCPFCYDASALSSALDKGQKMTILATIEAAKSFHAIRIIKFFELVAWSFTKETEWGVIIHLGNGTHRHLITARDVIKTYRTLDAAYTDVKRISGDTDYPVSVVSTWVRTKALSDMRDARERANHG